MSRLLLGLFLLLALTVVPQPKADAAKPNVLFLICDDLNCDLGSYGHPQVQTPNIDKLASRGVRFENAYCQYPLCGPSRASFMTGLYPDQTLVKRNAIYLREHVPNVLTMSQMFRKAGYFATRIGKIYHYGVPSNIGSSGHDDPFSWDATINPRGRDKDEEDKIFSLKRGNFGATLSWLAAEGDDQEQTDGVAATEAVELLTKYADTEQSFYLAVGLYRPHTPFVAPKKYFDLYPLDEIEVPQIPEGYFDTIPKPVVEEIKIKKLQFNMSDQLARQAIQAYYASITFADAQLGRILDQLEETGLDQNTIVLFTSDHGYHMGEHGHWQKRTLFDNGSRVPLILAGPGIEAKGKTTNSPAEMVDFYPTLAELCGLKTPDYVSGVSLAKTLVDPAIQPRESALTQLKNGYSIRTDRYRYSEWGSEGELGKELYDHQTDPKEMNNLIDDAGYSERIDELSILLRKRIANAKEAPAGVKQIKFDNYRRVRS